MSKFGEAEKLVPKFIWRFFSSPCKHHWLKRLIFLGEWEDFVKRFLEAYSEKDMRATTGGNHVIFFFYSKRRVKNESSHKKIVR